MEIPMVIAPLVLWPDPDTGPWHVRFFWANMGGRARLIGVDLHGFAGDGLGPAVGTDPAMVDSALLRSVPLIRLADQALAAEREALAGPSVEMADALLGDDTRVRRPRLPIEGPDGLRRVAEIYRLGGSRPVQAVAEALTISPSAAAKRVQSARRAGLL